MGVGALPRNGVVTPDREGKAVWSTVPGLRGASARGTFDLYRVRQLRLEATNDAGRAQVGLLRARPGINQTPGVVP